MKKETGGNAEFTRLNVIKSTGRSKNEKTKCTDKTIAKDLGVTLEELEVIYTNDPILRRMGATVNRIMKRDKRREEEFVSLHIDSFIEAEERCDWSREEFTHRMKAECKRLSERFWEIYNKL